MVYRSPQWLLHDVSVWGGLHLGVPLHEPVREADGPQARRRASSPGVRHGAGQGFAGSTASCKIGMLPEASYDKVRGGVVVIWRSGAFSFCEDGPGAVLDGADGGRDQKLRGMFVSPRPPGEGQRRRLAGHHRASLPGVRAPSDPADGGDRVRGEPDQHLRDRDDGQVGGAVPGRRVPVAERAADGEERGGVGRVHEAERRGEVPAVLPRRRQHLVRRRAVPRHGLRTQEEDRRASSRSGSAPSTTPMPSDAVFPRLESRLQMSFV
ncbi:hypothetical protein PVAP13_2NG460600 [Panicum virgatum]|uniref:Uncharacterized protein n=1 Tax=Panicum virgatum TaxID=38727 RepID=A0A8T0VMZ6_PANVG|nr:hypothetical protein PVAP13_2NG460600 [Panicum virgatum]